MFGEVRYSLETTDPPSSQFQVNSSTGEITASALDREAVQLYTLTIRVSAPTCQRLLFRQYSWVSAPTPSQSHSLFLQAEDSDSGPTVDVEVVVQDINDVTPNFTLPEYVAQVAENVPPGKSVMVLDSNPYPSIASKSCLQLVCMKLCPPCRYICGDGES